MPLKNKIIFKLLLLAVLMFSLHSCIREETYASLDPASKEYTSKSLWKEDEKYISNVRKVFDQYADKNYFFTNSGEIYWDYALTMGTFDESFLEVPVIKNGKINYILVVYREEDKIYFKRKDDRNSKEFFNILVFKNRSQLKGKIVEDPSNNNEQNRGPVCYTVDVTWTWTNDDGSKGGTYSYSETRCEQTGPYLPCTSVDQSGSCAGGSSGAGSGHGGGGYPYLQPEKVKSPCERLKDQNSATAYKAIITALDKTSVFNQKRERGYSESKSGEFTELQAAASTSASDGMTIPVSSDTKGYIHTHLNDYDTGLTNDDGANIIKQPIRMFSPADVNVLMTMASFVTDDKYDRLYGTMVSSYGNYTIKFTGTASDIKTGFDTQTWRDNYRDYKKLHDSWSFEKLFLNFLKDKMNVKGVELYKIKSNGTIQKKTLNSNNNVQSSDCPQ